MYPKPNAIDPPATVDPSELAAQFDFEYAIATNYPVIPWPQAYRNSTYIVYRNPRISVDPKIIEIETQMSPTDTKAKE